MYHPPSPAQYPAHTATAAYSSTVKDVGNGGYNGAAHYLPTFGLTGVHGAYSGGPTFGATGQAVNQGTYTNLPASYPTTHAQDSNVYSSRLHPVVNYPLATAPAVVQAQAAVVDHHPIAEPKRVSSVQTFQVHRHLRNTPRV